MKRNEVQIICHSVYLWNAYGGREEEHEDKTDVVGKEYLEIRELHCTLFYCAIYLHCSIIAIL